MINLSLDSFPSGLLVAELSEAEEQLNWVKQTMSKCHWVKYTSLYMYNLNTYKPLSRYVVLKSCTFSIPIKTIQVSTSNWSCVGKHFWEFCVVIQMPLQCCLNDSVGKEGIHISMGFYPKYMLTHSIELLLCRLICSTWSASGYECWMHYMPDRLLHDYM